MIERIVQNIKNLRFKDAQPYVMMADFGYLLANGLLNTLLNLLNFIIFYIGANLVIVTIFGINNVFDADIDRKVKKSNPISLGKITKQEGILFSIISMLVGFLILNSIGLGLIGKSIAILLIILGTLYVMPPFRFKERPAVDLICIGLIGGTLPFLLGFWLFSNVLNITLVVFSSMLFVVSMLFELQHHFFDLKNDTKTKTKTFINVYGINIGRYIMLGLSAIGLILITYSATFDIKFIIFVPSFFIALFQFYRKNLGAELYHRIFTISFVLYLII